jgi:tellurite resistance protein TerC
MIGYGWLWFGFNAFVLLMLALDLGVFHRKAHEVRFAEAMGWTLVWVALALAFNFCIWRYPELFFSDATMSEYVSAGKLAVGTGIADLGEQAALEFLTGYLIEKSLSIDNVFVFAMTFSYFSVPPLYQHKVLFWGILGALVMRAVMIFAGAALIQEFGWVIYPFALFLVLTGGKMIVRMEERFEPDSNIVVRNFKRVMPVTPEYRADRFFVMENGRRHATPLFIVLLVIEITDLIFAVDSIPAVFAITTNEFIVYTSNVFAILGLRSLYFVLAGMMEKFHLLKVGLGIVLIFVGVKMGLAHTAFKIPTAISLCMVVGIIAGAIAASLMFPKRARQEMPHQKTGLSPRIAEEAGSGGRE